MYLSCNVNYGNSLLFHFLNWCTRCHLKLPMNNYDYNAGLMHLLIIPSSVVIFCMYTCRTLGGVVDFLVFRKLLGRLPERATLPVEGSACRGHLRLPGHAGRLRQGVDVGRRWKDVHGRKAWLDVCCRHIRGLVDVGRRQLGTCDLSDHVLFHFMEEQVTTHWLWLL